MPVSKDLRTVIGRLDVALAAGDSYHRTELSRLRQELDLIAGDAETAEGRAGGFEQLFAEIGDGLGRSAECLQRLQRRAFQGAGQ